MKMSVQWEGCQSHPADAAAAAAGEIVAEVTLICSSLDRPVHQLPRGRCLRFGARPQVRVLKYTGRTVSTTPAFLGHCPTCCQVGTLENSHEGLGSLECML